MNDQIIYFHVGLGKTATTFLQDKFFPNLQGIEYIHSTKFSKAEDIIKRSSSSKILASREFDRQFEPEISKFAQLFTNVVPIIVLRRHDQWIASQFRRFIKNGFRGTFQEFLDLENDNGFFKIEHLSYMKMIKSLEKKFERPPIVLIYEELRENPVLFMENLVKKMEVSVDIGNVDLSRKHTSYNEKQLKAIRKIGSFINLEKKGENRKNPLKRLAYSAVRYPTLYLGGILPDSLYSSDPLIDPKDLESVKVFFEKDWKACLERARN